MQQKQQSETLYEDIVEKVAVENQLIESELKKQTDAKLRQFRENHESEIKTVRKHLQTLMGKERQEEEGLANVKEVREGIQADHDQLQRENEYLKKKEMEFQAEVVRLKAKES
jgi:hypothetical protein